MHPPLTNPFDYPPPEPNVTWDQVTETISLLPLSIGIALHQRITAVTQAQAPGPFSDALGELEAYLDALDDANLFKLERQLLIKNYVMRGWIDWRKSFVVKDRQK